jgi:hypothetical protein
MTADPLSPLVPGLPFPVEAVRWNAVFDAVRRQRGAPTTTPRRGELGWGGVVEVMGLNDTGADLREYRPVTATDAGGYELPTNDTAWQRAPLLTLSDFTATDDIVFVTLEAIPDGQVGRVAVLGTVLCDVEVTDTGHKFAEPAAGDTDRLHSATSGPVRIIHIPDGEGSTRRCVVFLGGGCCGGEPYVSLGTCPVMDCTGTYMVGIIEKFKLAGGSIVCVDIPPGDCCDEWWCTEEGVVSQPIADRGTPPEGVISGPYPVEELAETACVEQVELCDCGPPQNIPRFLHYEFRNRTGSAATLLPDELVIDYTGAGPHTAFDAGLSIAVQFDVTGEECSPEFRVHHTLGTHTFAIDTAAPNTVYGGFSYDLRAYADPPYDCDTNRFADALPLFLGTIDINGTGTFDWWLT